MGGRQEGQGRLVILALVLAVGLPVWVLIAPHVAASAATAGCSPTDPAPQVLSASADDVVVGSATHRETNLQLSTVWVRDACGGMLDFQGCSYDPPRPCFTGQVSMHRTSAAPVSARRCGRFLNTFDNTDLHRPSPGDPAVVEVGFAHSWDAWFDEEEMQPRLTNACAGAWDLTASFSHTSSDGSTAVGAPMTTVRAFSVRRRAALTTNAGPEPVHAGGLVTVRGRLTRADWNGRPYQPYDGMRVALQRRSETGRYTTLRWIRTGTDGRLRTTLRALSTPRCYRWVFPGSSTTAPADGNGDCLALKG